ADGASGAPLDTRILPNSNTSTNSANFVNGTYLIWNISGHVTITVEPNSGPNGVVSGIFFGGGTSAIAATGGAQQSAIVGTAFSALQATVTNNGAGVSGAQVTFTAPASGASGTFSNGANTITIPTNGAGQASAPFTANSTAGGPYLVTASALSSGVSGSASFSLTNTNSTVQSIAATGGTPQSA